MVPFAQPRLTNQPQINLFESAEQTERSGSEPGIFLCLSWKPGWNSGVFDGRSLHRQRTDVPLHEGIEAGHIGGIRSDRLQLGVGEHVGVQIVGQTLPGRPAGEKGGEHSDAPGTAF